MTYPDPVRALSAIAVVLVASTLAGAVQADEDWYGAPVLVTGGSAALLVTAAIAAADDDVSPWLAGLGGGAYVFGGPITHWANDEVGKGFGSLGLNVGLAGACGLIGALIGAASAGDGDFAGLAAGLLGGAIGLGVGSIAAVAIDTTLLTYRD
jgi:hypothetical protein